MKHLQKHRGRLYYRRKVPADLLPAFNDKPHWRRALELSVDAPQAEITARWAELHQNFEDLIDLARRSNKDVLSEVELEKKARAYLRNERIEASMLRDRQHAIDAVFGPMLDDIEHTRRDGRELSPQQQVIDRAYWLAVADSDELKRKTLLFSECYSIYIESRGIDTGERRHKNVKAHWERFLQHAGDQSATKGNIEEAIDSYVDQRDVDGVTSATIQRELNLVSAVLRRGLRKHRMDVTFTLPELKRHKRQRRPTLSAKAQQELVERVVDEEIPLAEGLTIIFGLSGGMILSETQRLLKTSVHLESHYPHLFVQGDAKTDARLRPVPITVALTWVRSALRELDMAEPDCPFALGSRWHALTESGTGAAVKRWLPGGYTSYSLRHAARANAIANCGGDFNANAALICGWTASGGLSEHMFDYATSALEEQQEELLGGLTETSRLLNRHLIDIERPQLAAAAK